MHEWQFGVPAHASMQAPFGWLVAALLAAAVAAFCVALPAQASEDRVALVIGNDAYPTEPLKNAVNDAQQVARTLSELGFKVVFKTNADFTTMRAAAVEFANLLDNNYAAVFYFAGHGIQYRGKNYLVPIDARLNSETEVVFNALEVTQILERMQDGNVRHKFLILDACRNNPFRAVFGSNATPGLAKMQTPPGTTIAFAAQAGAVAEDGKGENGVYTKNLLNELKRPDVQAALMFQQVSQAVQLETMGRQTPEVQSVAASKGLFFFNDSRLSSAAPGDAMAVQIAKPDASRPSADTETKVDLEFWSAVKDSSRVEDIQAYLDQFPKGRFAVLARNRIDALKRAAQVAAKPVREPEPARNKPAAEPKPEPLPKLADSRGIDAKPAAQPVAVAVETPVVTNPAAPLEEEKEPAAAAEPGEPVFVVTPELARSKPPEQAAAKPQAPPQPPPQVAALAPKPQAPEPVLKSEPVERGEGIITFSGGARYSGQYKEMKGKEKILHGKGEYSTRDFTYSGEFKDGKKHGRGLYKWPNGDSFEGDFADDLPNGRGRYHFASGDEYMGDIVAGRITGQGVYVTREQDRIEGSFVDAKANGQAVYLFANGDRYEGEMAAGRLSGKGVYTTKGRDRIEAVFRDGKADGEGVCYFANNDRYEGEMKAGALTGKGKYFYSNGLRSEGEFVDGRLKGKGVFYFNDGSRFEGEFEDGLKSAKGFSFLKDGSKHEAVIVDNAVKITGG